MPVQMMPVQPSTTTDNFCKDCGYSLIMRTSASDMEMACITCTIRNDSRIETIQQAKNASKILGIKKY